MRLIDADKFKMQVATMAISEDFPIEKVNAMLKLIDGQPTQLRWITVSERLPAEPPEGLVYMDDLQENAVMIAGAERATFCTYSGNGEWYRDGVFYNVVAWMPLPEPYRPED